MLIDSSAHTKWRGREHPPAAGESISLRTPEIVIWKSSVLFTSVRFLLSFKAVSAIKMPKEDRGMLLALLYPDIGGSFI